MSNLVGTTDAGRIRVTYETMKYTIFMQKTPP